ncbi:hypothetical protein CON15_19350 [Bacillus cereus]|uniref:DUF4259 domain-containing protein n=1 Tax=Bacillus thuringiensis TaxID=1428 RepID=A0AB36VG14_BACTU|nr:MULTISPECIES: DUF4259 domain-containing protein [Bacillus cereus group]PDZ55698.1 hypothetical protein CON15_19350 [Bacillus cereus]PFC28477.1 hypothetical protein CN299_19595 [Bacillus thuringiensis]PFO26226.1 hypothetical protein COJ78_29425 [Bacillus thuringiensis]PFS40318.1 hypothetical protein COK48_00305 [Bacillus thuringiensis]PFS58225.1 hypothetical protein COK64_17750 [Bacillus thuringiensis]
MGAWGYGIYENDSAVDIAEGFQDYLEEGKSVETALRRICEDYSDCKSEEYVLALVELQIRYGIVVDLPLFDEAKKMCTDEEAMQDWDEPEERREELNKLLKKMQIFTPSVKRESSIYVLPINLHAYRRQGELPKVVGVVMFKPSGNFEERMCYKVEYHSDGFVDYIPMSGVEIGNYKLITQEQCDKELLKEITNDNL